MGNILCFVAHCNVFRKQNFALSPCPLTLLYVFLPPANFNLYPSPVMFHTVSIIAFRGVCKSFLLGNCQNWGWFGEPLPTNCSWCQKWGQPWGLCRQASQSGWLWVHLHAIRRLMLLLQGISLQYNMHPLFFHLAITFVFFYIIFQSFHRGKGVLKQERNMCGLYVLFASVSPKIL